MKFGKTLLVSAIVGLVVAHGTRDARASKPDPPPAPGIKGEITVTGEEIAGSIIEANCRFMIPHDAHGVKQLETRSEGDHLSAGVDSVLFYSDTNIVILTNPVWKGILVPGKEFSFSVTVLLKDGFEGNLYVAAYTRYGIQSIGYVPFFFGKRPRPLGYVTDVIVDSLGNYWHKHRAVMDSTLAGFVPFDSSNTRPPDTSFDKTGKVIFVQQVRVRVVEPGSINIKRLLTPLKVGPGLKQFQQKPTGKT